MSFIDKSSLWALKEEASYGAGATIVYATDTVELINPTMDTDIDLLERETLKNSLVMDKPVLGKEMSSGSLPLEVTALSSGALNGAVLYKSALGVEIAAVASEVASGVTAGVVGVASGAAYEVGQAIKLVDVSASTTEYAVIRSITANDLTVAPVPTAAGIDVTVTGLHSYRIAAPATPTTSFVVEEYLEDASTAIAYTYTGCVATGMAMEFPLAGIIKATFSIAGAGFSVATGVANQSKQCFGLNPHVAKNMTFTYGGTSYDASDLSLNVTSDVTDIEAVTTDGITNKVVVGKSEVGGSFALEYEGVALFNSYQAGSTGELFGTVTTGGATAGVYAPRVTLSNVGKNVDAGVYRDAVDYRCLSSALCENGVEDALTIFFE
jgi:hypothetical protein